MLQVKLTSDGIPPKNQQLFHRRCCFWFDKNKLFIFLAYKYILLWKQKRVVYYYPLVSHVHPDHRGLDIQKCDNSLSRGFPSITAGLLSADLDFTFIYFNGVRLQLILTKLTHLFHIYTGESITNVLFLLLITADDHDSNMFVLNPRSARGVCVVVRLPPAIKQSRVNFGTSWRVWDSPTVLDKAVRVIPL